MNKFWVVLFIILSYSAFAGNDGDNDKKFPFNYGRMQDTVYVNPFFGFKIAVPSAWTVQNKTQIDFILDKGKDLLEFDDEMYNKAVKNVDVNSMTLLMLSKYEVGAPVPFNPTVVILAESVLTSPGIKTGSDYLYHVGNGLKKSNLNYDCTPGLDSLMISPYTFGSLLCTREGAESHLGYYTAIIKKYAFSFIFTYSNDEERNELLSVIHTLVFKN